MFRPKPKKRSFFERLTGSVHIDDDLDFDNEEEQYEQPRSLEVKTDDGSLINEEQFDDEGDGQLAVDVLQTSEFIIIKAMVAGVRPSDLDIDITRDMGTIRGIREEEFEESDENYFHRELYWGSFSRNILLPEEVDVEASEATEKNGLLTLKLPKLDRNRKAKLHVKSK